MKRRMNLYVNILVVGLLILPGMSLAQRQEAITQGVKWLRVHQNPDSTWGGAPEDITSPFQSTAEVLNSFWSLEITDSTFNKGLKWLSYQPTPSVDHLSRQIETVIHTKPEIVSKVDTLLLYQNPVGGFGVDFGCQSDNLDALLALCALKAAEYSDTPLQDLILYLMSTQMPDSSWSISSYDTSSSVFITSKVLFVLEQYADIYYLEDCILPGITWLEGQQNANGSFGVDTTNIYETAWAILASLNSGEFSTAVEPAVSFLLAHRESNGSWNDNAYETALTIRALSSVKPNLKIESQNIACIPDIPVEGDTSGLTAFIYNTGYDWATNFVVRFYNDNPDSGGTQIDGDIVVDSMGVNDSMSVEVLWVPVAGRHTIWVFADAQDSIKEISEEDNIAFRDITIATKPDLAVTPDNIIIEPPDPYEGDTVAVNVRVYNRGETAVDSVRLRIYDGLPFEDGVMIGEFIIHDFPGGVDTVLEVSKVFSPGSHVIYAVIDPENWIPETDEANNEATRSFNVTPLYLDLAVFSANISCFPVFPVEDDSLAIYAVIHNVGSSDAFSVRVRFYDGEPLEQNIIGEEIIAQVPAEDVGTAHILWSTVGQADTHTIYVVVDPLNEIDETNETNNQAHTAIYIAPGLPDLAISSTDFSYTPTMPDEGDTVVISLVVHNTGVHKADSVKVVLSDGDPLHGGISIGEAVILKIEPKDSALVQALWYTSGKGGDHTIYGVIDPQKKIPEIDEANNQASIGIYIGVAGLPDLAVYPADISFTPEVCLPGESIDITALIHNLGGMDAESVYVKFYDGDPGAGGTQIGTEQLIEFLAAGGDQEVSVNWTSQARAHKIYVKVDPWNKIQEGIETNNIAYKEIFVGNYAPVLSWTGEPGFSNNSVEPDVGDSTTLFEYRVSYIDIENNPPASSFPKVWIDITGDGDYKDTLLGFVEKGYSMTAVNPADLDHTDGKLYTYSTQLPTACKATYRFEAVDSYGDTAIEDIPGPVAINGGPVVGNFPPSVNVMPEYTTWPNRSPYYGETIWGNVKDPNWRPQEYSLDEIPPEWEVDYGNNTGLSGDNEYTLVSLPFNVNFYDTSFNEVYISTNGFIDFSSKNSHIEPENRVFPNTQDKFIIAPYWDDLFVPDSGGVYYTTVGILPNRRFVISWVDVTHKDHAENSYIFQVILLEGGEMRFGYEKINAIGGDSPTVGVNKGDGIEYQIYPTHPTSKLALYFPETSYDLSTIPTQWVMDAGDNTGLSGDNEYTSLSLPFTFSFYDTTFTTVYVSTNGFVDFSTQNTHIDPNNRSFPNTQDKYLIAPYWDDLFVGVDAGVYYMTTGVFPERKFIISWVNVTRKDHSENRYTFQVILHENSDIRFNYDVVNAVGGDSSTVGVNRGNGVEGTEFPARPMSLSSLSFPTLGYQMTEGALEWESDYGENTGIRDGNQYKTYTLPFGFTFYDSTFTTLYVNALGFVDFLAGNNHINHYNTDFPYTTMKYIIAPFWDFLNIYRGGIVYYNILGTSPNRRAVITWYGLPHYSRAGYHEFQAILYENGTIKFNYQQMINVNDDPTVGLNMGDTLHYTLYEQYPDSGRTLTFTDRRYPCIPASYDWEERGTVVDLKFQVPCFAKISLPFDFEFYDKVFSDAFLSAHGSIDFDPSNSHSKWNSDTLFPTTTDLYLIATFFEWLAPQPTSKIYYTTMGTSPDRKFIVTWARVPRDPNEGLHTFQTVLHENGEVMFNYKKMIDVNDDPLVGLNKGDGVLGTVYPEYPESGTSLLFKSTKYTIVPTHYYWEGNYGTLTGATADHRFYPIALPFSFVSYDITIFAPLYIYLGINSDGYINFTRLTWGKKSSGANPPFPALTQSPTFAAFWDDLYWSGHGEIYYRILGTTPNRKVVVTWLNFPYVDAHGSHTFQAIIYENGQVKYNYNSMISVGEESPTIGVNKGDGELATVYAKYPSYNQSLLFTPYYPDSLTYMWNFDDGSADTGVVRDLHYIAARHVYDGGIGATYKPVLTVTDATGQSDQDTTTVNIKHKDREVMIDQAIENGLRLMYCAQNEDGSWKKQRCGGGTPIHSTAACLLAFENKRYSAFGDYEKDIYAEYIKKGLDFLFTTAHSKAITGDPADTDNDGIGIRFDGYYEVFETPFVMMAVIGSMAPDSMATTGPPCVNGHTYREIMEDAMNYVAWCQIDTGNFRGTWAYPDYRGSYSGLVGWCTMALGSLEEEWDVLAPEWVKSEALIWLASAQQENGSFKYKPPEFGLANKTANGIGALSYCGVFASDESVTKALGYLDSTWNKHSDFWTGGMGYCYWIFKNFYTMYAIAKSCRMANPPIEYIGSHDWYSEFADHIIASQISPYHPTESGWYEQYWSDKSLSTAYAILILNPFTIGAPPVADAGPDQIVASGDTVILDGSVSYHSDPDKILVKYEWDFNADTIYDTTGVVVKHVWSDTGKYFVTLRVWDNSKPSKWDIDACMINVTTENHPPVANASGPYIGLVGQPIVFDGRRSYDSDTLVGDYIKKYGWDLDGDGLFLESTDSIVEFTWDSLYSGSIGLEVTDSRPFPHALSDTDWTWVTVTTLAISSLGALPDPFSPGSSPGVKDKTEIKYQLAFPCSIQVKIYNQSNNLIRTLGPTEGLAGENIEIWNGKHNDLIAIAESGLYSYRIEIVDTNVYAENEIEIDNIHPTALIFEPFNGDTINSSLETSVAVIGTATDRDYKDDSDNFKQYRLGYGQGENPTEWTLLGDGNIPIENGIFATLDVRELSSGIYTIRLRATDIAGNESQYLTRVIIVHYPDLEITQGDINFLPSSPIEGDSVVIATTVHNTGRADANNVAIEFYNGNPSTDGTQIGETQLISLLPSESDTAVQVIWNTLGYPGTNYIYVLVDPQNNIEEINEDNNTAMKSIDVAVPPLPDLIVSPEDIVCTPSLPEEGDEVTIFATIHNMGTEIRHIGVRFYDGEPILGQQIGSDQWIDQTISLGDTATVSVDWNTLGVPGLHTLFVTVDPDSLIDEQKEDNNVAFKEVKVESTNVTLTLALNKPVYDPYEDVGIQLEVSYIGVDTIDLSCEVGIYDTSDNSVSKVAFFDIIGLITGEKRDTMLLWNTERTLWGGYKVKASVTKDAQVVAARESSFDIQPDINVTLEVTADKIDYTANEQVTITGRAKNTSANHIFENLHLRVDIRDFLDTTMDTFSIAIPNLPLDGMSDPKFYWNTGRYPSGSYRTIGVIQDSLANILSTDTTTFGILPSFEFVGSIAAIPDSIDLGDNFMVKRSIINVGNTSVKTIPLVSFIVEPISTSPVDTLIAQISLDIDSTYRDSFLLSTADYIAGSYMLILAAVVETDTFPVASSGFRVIYWDIEPPVISDVVPQFDTYVCEDVTLGATVTDTTSGVRSVEYCLDAGAWTSLPLVSGDSMVGSYSTTWNTTPGDDGGHTLEIRAEDYADNDWNTIPNDPNPVAVQFKVDNTLPLSALEVDTPVYVRSETTFVSSGSPISIFGNDPVINGVASGIDSIHYTITPGRDTTCPDSLVTFYLIGDDGVYKISYYSIDKVGNTETPKDTLLVLDNTPPPTQLSISKPNYSTDPTYVTSSSQFTLTAVDEGSGVATTEYKIDAGSWVTYSTSFSIAEEDIHTVYYRSVDNLGNEEPIDSVAVAVDNTHPTSNLIIGEPKFVYGAYDSVIVTSATPETLIAYDSLINGVACGVASVNYKITPGLNWIEIQDSITVFNVIGDDRRYIIEYKSIDHLGNEEPSDSQLVILNNTLPICKIISPLDSTLINGTITIIGTATDTHFNYYKVEYGVGDNPATWILITQQYHEVIDSTLATWNTDGLSGIYTLKLTAVDVVGNTNEDRVFLIIGEPQFEFEITGFNKCEGVDVDNFGYIYVADRNSCPHQTHNRIAKFDPLGGFIEQFPDELKPNDVSLDEAGNIYVTAWAGGCMTKYSPAGDSLMRIDGFNKPDGVDVDREGNIYIADQNNKRVLIYTSSGDQTLEITGLLHPEGVAVDTLGNIYVAEANGHKVKKYDTSGNLLLEFGGNGSAPGQFVKPSDVTIDHRGYIWVVDRNNDRIQMFDFWGNLLMNFGNIGNQHGEFNKPEGIAIDENLNIFIADRNNDRVQKLIIPSFGSTLMKTFGFSEDMKLEIKEAIPYPNPFNPLRENSKIRVVLSKDADVTIRIYTLTGKLVYEEKALPLWEGPNDIAWDGRNELGELVNNGVYNLFVKAKSGDERVEARSKIAVTK